MGGPRLLCPRPQPDRLRPRGGGGAAASRERRRAAAACPASATIPSAAIAAIAFGETAAAVDTNVERVDRPAARARAIRSRAEIEALVLAMMPADRAGRLRPGDDGPRRDHLPAARRRAAANARCDADCAAFASGNPEAFPAREAPGGPAAAAWHRLLDRARRRSLAGPAPGQRPARRHGRAARHATGSTPLPATAPRRSARVRHVFTHFALELRPGSPAPSPSGEGWWHPIERPRSRPACRRSTGAPRSGVLAARDEGRRAA